MPSGPIIVGRCELFGEVARGGMATVHLGRVIGAGKFAKTVAIKRMYDKYARDPDFSAMFLDEAQLVARVRHPNVVPTLDLIEEDGELLIVMDFVDGVTLRDLVDAADENGERIPYDIAVALVAGTLRGLHAAHEAKDEQGKPLGCVHRDVSPENILVGRDGFPRLIDFGIAKALDRVSTTGEGELKGKLHYMAPEMLDGADLSRRTDIFLASIVLWELLTGERLFKGNHAAESIYRISKGNVAPPSSLEPDLPAGLDDIVMRGLAKEPKDRWATALAMAETLEALIPPASPSEVGAWVEELAEDQLRELARLVREMESAPRAKSQTREDTQVAMIHSTVPASPTRWKVVAGTALLALLFFGVGAMMFRGESAPETGSTTASPTFAATEEPRPEPTVEASASATVAASASVSASATASVSATAAAAPKPAPNAKVQPPPGPRPTPPPPKAPPKPLDLYGLQ